MLSLYEIAKLRTRQQLIDIVGEGGGVVVRPQPFFFVALKLKLSLLQ